MTRQLNYGNLKRSPFLEDFIVDQLRRLDRFQTEKAHMNLWLSHQPHFERGTEPQFQVQVEINRPHRKNYFVKKKSRDFFLAMRKVVKTVENQLRKEK